MMITKQQLHNKKWGIWMNSLFYEYIHALRYELPNSPANLGPNMPDSRNFPILGDGSHLLTLSKRSNDVPQDIPKNLKVKIRTLHCVQKLVRSPYIIQH